MRARWMMMVAALACGMVLSLPARAELTAAQKADVEAVVKAYLLQNPEVLRDALTELDRREKEQSSQGRITALSAQKEMIYNSPHQAVVGNPKGKVTLVEFFDYNCGYCKQSLGDITRLIKDEPELRVVLKDFPILTPGSLEAARVAIALRAQFQGDKYWQFHAKLLGTRGSVAKAQALGVAQDMGADMAKLAKDLEASEVTTSLAEIGKMADGLNLTGTPTFVIGQEVLVGAQPYDELRAKIGNMSKCGQATCG